MPYKDKEKRKEQAKEYRQKPEVKERIKEYCQKPEVKERIKEYCQKPEVMKRRRELDKKRYRKNPDRLKKYGKKYNQIPEVKVRRKVYIRKYYQKNKDKIILKVGEYRQKNKARRNEYHKQRKRDDLNFHLLCRLRLALNSALKHYSKTGKIYFSKKYGIDYKKIIEKLKPFPKNIKNYHIDHIIPLSRFDFNNAKHIKIAFAPENHQWLTIKENLEKNDKLIMPH